MTKDPLISAGLSESQGSPVLGPTEPQRAEGGPVSEPSSTPWSLIGAIVFFSVAASISLTFLVAKFVPSGMAQPNVVTFDAIRFTNSQRAVASRLAFKGGGSDLQAADTAIVLNQSARVEQTIREVAGEKTIVLVKQAVVDSKYPDITEAVLTRLGLPTNVPSVQPDLSGAGYGQSRKLLEAPTAETNQGVLP